VGGLTPRHDGHQPAINQSQQRRAVAEHRPAVLYGETLSNPQLRLMDIPALAAIAHRAGARLVVDNTFATPFCARPLALGADVVVESATKFLAGHSDVVAGAVTLDDEALAAEVQRRLITFGGCLDPHAAFLAWRGMRTFGVRLAEACRAAEVIASKMADERDIEHVRYPGRLDHPDAGAVVDAVMPDRRAPCSASCSPVATTVCCRCCGASRWRSRRRVSAGWRPWRACR
jgi:cystathionine beta-lyase/cystathionine gamma-synthase